MTWTCEFACTLPAEPARVYAALTTADELTRWFAEAVEVSLHPGGAYRFWGRHSLATPTAAQADQRILALEAGRRLEFSWRLYGIPTRVAMELTAHPKGTRLSLCQTVEGDLPVPRPRELLEDHWRLALGNLLMHLGGGAGLLLPDYGASHPEIRFTLTIDAPPSRVFQALLEPALINQWFGCEAAEVEPRPGGRYTLGWKYQVDGREVAGGPTTILELIPDRRLVLDWPDWRGDTAVTGQTITFELEPVGQATRLTFRHAGFSRTADLSDYPFGWREFLDGLVRVAEAAPGA